MRVLILLPIFLPILAGACLAGSSFRDKIALQRKEQTPEDIQSVHAFTLVTLLISVCSALLAAWLNGEKSEVLFYLMKDLPVYFHVDEVGALFVTFLSIIWVCTAVYAFVYMKHEGEEKRFFGCFLMVYGVLAAQDFAGNLITLYFFYELMTLVSVPLVLHNGSREAIMGGLKYLFYSMCGAYLGLFGIFFLYQNTNTLSGGALNVQPGQERILLIAVFCMLVGFGAKAGMFPLHAWLPTAHPVAPTPASAVLSAVIVKAGVLAILRAVYYVVGPYFLQGTWVQTAWMTLALLTVFMGSLLAFREPVFKKRLAYSTVSQVSYILFGLSLLSEGGVTGALLHTVFHAFIKCALFLTAGIFIFQTGKTRAEDYAGYGKKMPRTLLSYTFASLALIGIPPASGFISKWYLAQGALSAAPGAFRYVGPVVLLVSALLTAGYLLPVTLRGFFPGIAEGKALVNGAEGTADGSSGKAEYDAVTLMTVKEPSVLMWLPLLVLALLALVLGMFPNPLIAFVSRIAGFVMW